MKFPNDLPLLTYLGKLMGNFSQILRTSNLDSISFLDFLLNLEKQISQVLLNESSFCKFIFEVNI